MVEVKAGLEIAREKVAEVVIALRSLLLRKKHHEEQPVCGLLSCH